MDESLQLKSILEGLLFAAGEEGLTNKELAKVLETDKNKIDLLVHELRVDWKEQQRGMQIIKVAQTYQITTLPEHYPYLARMARTPRHAKLSRSSLETLAIIAYRQPITRIEIEEIRGVKSDHVLQKLQQKKLVCAVGRAEGVGRPRLYGTTQEFLSYFGLNHIDELPSPHTIFNWQEWETDKQDLIHRLGVSKTKKEIEQDETDAS
ncbi:segregation and condensation protein B [Seinonella peptonophila]|uniref:Segregation and condensation protein B n=1 Tax=Seinonella peptonophila TaxID=112248 RepID=A0A1M4TJD2_9BACL|nr:SMC-Scp complex subunit ScpB [Seinonella peptonophila]SHE44528.1 segregation and condensation protein B [Seinonella peptonophila]